VREVGSALRRHANCLTKGAFNDSNLICASSLDDSENCVVKYQRLKMNVKRNDEQ
jgi:hypothetical protein